MARGTAGSVCAAAQPARTLKHVVAIWVAGLQKRTVCVATAIATVERVVAVFRVARATGAVDARPAAPAGLAILRVVGDADNIRAIAVADLARGT